MARQCAAELTEGNFCSGAEITDRPAASRISLLVLILTRTEMCSVVFL